MGTADVVIDVDAAARSANMARIRGKDTGPEVALRRALWRTGLRYRLGMRVEGARPDLTFPQARLVVFVDGCFWHGCPLHYVRPRTKEEFWALKLAVNTDRDRRQTVLLRSSGWHVIRVWEHELAEDLDRTVEAIRVAYRQQDHSLNLVPDRDMVVRVEPIDSPERCLLESWRIESLTDPAVSRIEIRERRVRVRGLRSSESTPSDSS